jgi:hypothetical protein
MLYDYDVFELAPCAAPHLQTLLIHHRMLPKNNAPEERLSSVLIWFNVK